jgi:hypothetical protein
MVGGDRSAIDEVLTDRRLAPLLPLVTGRLLDVPDPRLKVLEKTPDLFRAVRITVVDPDQPDITSPFGPIPLASSD